MATLGGVRAETAAGGSLMTAIIIVEADDIVLAEITADLNLDQLKLYLSRIEEPMNAADRNVDRLVFVDDTYFGADSDFGSASHHHPMFGAVEVLLQRQLGVR